METRTFNLDEGVLTRTEGDGRTISGIAVPYNTPAQIQERGMKFTEQFAPGAFRDTIAMRGNRVKLYVNHDETKLPIGRGIVTEHKNALTIEGRIAETRDGLDALALINEDVADSFSIGFSPMKGGDQWSADRSQRTLTRAMLHEVSLAIGKDPAYQGAVLESVRTDETEPEIEEEPTGPLFRVRWELELSRLELVYKRTA